MLKKLFRLTKSGAEELSQELGKLMAERSLIAEHIKSAREFGDLSENAEYQSARLEQDKNESRISEVEHILHNLEIIKSPHSGSQVQLGSTVKLRSHASATKTKEFQVVGTVEANPLEGKISDESPIGRALLGKKVGEEVEIKTTGEKAIYKISEIS
ncbi:MAG: transcription elongation factor GreA [Candidatus Saccharimonadales bacterium]